MAGQLVSKEGTKREARHGIAWGGGGDLVPGFEAWATGRGGQARDEVFGRRIGAPQVRNGSRGGG